MRKSVLIMPTGRISLFGIRFRHAGAFPFFQFSLSELTDRIEDIESIWGNEGRDIEERVCKAGTFAERIAIVESILTARLIAHKQFDTTIIEAARLIVGRDGVLPIRHVAELIGISERRLEREFKQKIGVSPKLFSRIIRFQKLIKALEGEGAAGLLDKALEFGYYDQAHMVHEFREFAGKSPTTFIDDAHRISEAFTGN
jgi:AraC-like DNA-binding protein